MFQQQNFKQGQRVIIHNFGDGKEYTGTIMGKTNEEKYYEGFPEHYIVKPDNMKAMKKHWDYECVSITEACLKAVEVQ